MSCSFNKSNVIWDSDDNVLTTFGQVEGRKIRIEFFVSNLIVAELANLCSKFKLYLMII